MGGQDTRPAAAETMIGRWWVLTVLGCSAGMISAPVPRFSTTISGPDQQDLSHTLKAVTVHLHAV
jgi:hypothetical protein